MATEEGLQVSLHPLPLLNISDHYTRQSLNHRDPSIRVVGGLLGTQSGRHVDIVNSFELALVDPPSTSDRPPLQLDHAYFATRRDQFRQVFPTFDFLGWYTVGEAPTPQETHLHKQFLAYNESPLFLQLSAVASSGSAPDPSSKDLPVTVYETVLEPSDKGEPEPVFVKVEYDVETGEAEKVAVDEVSKVHQDDAASAGGSGNTASLVATLASQRNALSMLSSRVALIIQYLEALSTGQAKRDDETLRQIQALVSGLKGQVGKGGELEQEFMTEYNDALLTTYLASLTKQLMTANELLDKQTLIVASSASNTGSSGGGGAGPRAGGGDKLGSGGRKGKTVVGGSSGRGGAAFENWSR
ncbi:hypothetical protein JCM10212_002953 [Sporobolomyces blumeae]